MARNLVTALFTIFTLVSTSSSLPSSTLDPFAITSVDFGHRKIPKDDNDGLYCESWMYNVETNNARNWTTIPPRCNAFVRDYMTGDRYRSVCAAVAEESLKFAETVSNVSVNSKDAWVFDIDETLLSTVPFFRIFGFGQQSLWGPAWFLYIAAARAPAVPASLELYKALQQLGFKFFLLTGRLEFQRNSTERNLVYAGFSNWERLIVRGPDDEGKPATQFKSEKRKEIEDAGYTIHGSSGDQWSDLNGFAIAKRSFKLPNPVYYAP